jgi:hypothetical protein
VQTERGEVERLRELLGLASISEETATAIAATTTVAAPIDQKSSIPAMAQQQQEEEPVQQPKSEPEPEQQQPEEPQKPLQQQPTPVPMQPAVGKPGAGPTPPMWVTVPMWMGQQPMAGGAKTMSFPMPVNMNGGMPGGPGGFPFATMPFFMPNTNGGAPIPASYLIPTPQAPPTDTAAVTTAGVATGNGSGGMMEMDDGELPTHAPCA